MVVMVVVLASPKSERRRAVICQFGLNGVDRGLNVVFPPGYAIQTSGGAGRWGVGGGGWGTAKAV